MKIKTDFTTNSSSSSFVCWGVSVDEVEGEGSDSLSLKAFEAYLLSNKKLLAKDGAQARAYTIETVSDMEALTTDEEKIEYVQENGLDEEVPAPLSRGGPYEDYGEQIIGICPDTLERQFPDVTFGNMRQFVAEKINEVLGTNLSEKDIDYHELAWRDG